MSGEKGRATLARKENHTSNCDPAVTVSVNPLISESLCDFRVGLLGTPEKRARGPFSPKLDPKSHEHSELV